MTTKPMKAKHAIRQNDPRLCTPGTEDLFSIVRITQSGEDTIEETIAENMELPIAELFLSALA